jgi:hypothetical protein
MTLLTGNEPVTPGHSYFADRHASVTLAGDCHSGVTLGGESPG